MKTYDEIVEKAEWLRKKGNAHWNPLRKVNIYDSQYHYTQYLILRWVLDLEDRRSKFDDLKGGSKMEISKYTKAQGMFLKAEDVKNNPKAVFLITTEGEMVKSEKFGNERLHLQGTFAEEDKTFDCSKTNSRAIAQVLGEETKKWIGKGIVFEIYKTKTSDGKLVEALNVKEIRM